MQPRPVPRVLALVRDLLFASRISAQGKSAGVEVRILRDPAQLPGESAPLLLVDLNQEGAPQAAAQWKQANPGRIVGFVSHVDVERIEEARRLGIDQVMARSGFVEALPRLMAGASLNS